jgi:hypothetical protein
VSQVDTASSPEHPERHYELRRRRVRRRAHRTEAEEMPGDPRVLRVGIGAMVAGLVLVVLLACSGGSGGVGTPTVSVYGSGSGVSVGNHSGAPMKAAVWSLNTFKFNTARMPENGATQMDSFSGGTQLVVLFGESGGWPHFWTGVVGGD